MGLGASHEWVQTHGLAGSVRKGSRADRIAVFVDIVFSNPDSHGGPSLALAMVLYSFQIYCDFSGYTDVAIGISQVFGFKLMDNFDRPYSARSIAEFWRRWHISFRPGSETTFISLSGETASARVAYT